MIAWTEHKHGGHRIRFRRRNGAGEPGQMFEVEAWHPGREEWRAVRNGSSRDWFAIGISVGLALTETGLQKELAL